MADAHTQFVGSIPEKYDQHLGPLFFEHYAADLAGRVATAADGRILEIACGTGISTQFLRAAVADSVAITATDLNPAMLDYARGRRGDLANVEFQQADALDLPFEDAAFDAVLCQFGLMFLPDKRAGIREAARVLKPGGLLALNVWDSLDRNPVARVAHEAIGRFFTDDPPTFLLLPYGYHDPDPIRAMLLGEGFVEVAVDFVDSIVERPTARHAAVGLVEGNPGIHEIRERASAGPEAVVDAVAAALGQAFGDAPMRAPLRAIVVTARRPRP